MQYGYDHMDRQLPTAKKAMLLGEHLSRLARELLMKYRYLPPQVAEHRHWREIVETELDKLSRSVGEHWIKKMGLLRKISEKYDRTRAEKQTEQLATLDNGQNEGSGVDRKPSELPIPLENTERTASRLLS